MGLQKKPWQGGEGWHSPRASRNREGSLAVSPAVQVPPGPYRNIWDWQGREEARTQGRLGLTQEGDRSR